MKNKLQEYLYQHIPLSKALGIRIECATSEKIILWAPFANNINHKKTVFGGSLHAVATLACWSLLYVALKEVSDGHYQIVITKSDVAYHLPVDDDFRVEVQRPEASKWQRFLQVLKAKGKARLELSASIVHKDHPAVTYQASFAALS